MAERTGLERRNNLLAADSQLTGAINIGHGEETSVLELVSALAQTSSGGFPAEPLFAPEAIDRIDRELLSRHLLTNALEGGRAQSGEARVPGLTPAQTATAAALRRSPLRVILGSSTILKNGPWRWLSARRCSFSLSASAVMVRNL